MSSLFDLFDRRPERGAETPAAATTPSRRRERCERTVFTVSDLTANIRNLLETAYAEVWVEAEISNCRLWNTGHLYFTLKDPGAQIKAVMFRSDVRTLKFKPEDGLHVVVRGRMSVYEPKGEYQLVCERMEPHGLGALQLAFDQLKRRSRPRACSMPHANARFRPCPAKSASSRRSMARRYATSSRCSAADIRTPIW